MKNKNIFESFQAAFRGFSYLYYNHKHLKINLSIALIIVFLSLFFDIELIEFSIIFLAVILVFLTEAINTSMEEICNLITTEYHPKIKVIKDLGSFFVLLSVIFSIIVFIVIFFL